MNKNDIDKMYSRLYNVYIHAPKNGTDASSLSLLGYYNAVIKYKLLFNIKTDKYENDSLYSGAYLVYNTQDGMSQPHQLYSFVQKYINDDLQKSFENTSIPKSFDMSRIHNTISFCIIACSLFTIMMVTFSLFLPTVLGLLLNVILLCTRNSRVLNRTYFKWIIKKIGLKYDATMKQVSLDIAYDTGNSVEYQKTQLEKYGLLYLEQL